MSSQTAEYHAKLTKKNEQIQALERHTHVVRSALANARAGLKELIAAAEEAEALEAWFERRDTTATDRRIHRVSRMSIVEDRVEAEDVLEAIDKYENAQSVFPPASAPAPEVVELKPVTTVDAPRIDPERSADEKRTWSGNLRDTGAAPTLAEAQSAVHIAMTRAVNRLDCDCGATCEGTCTQALLVAAAKKLDAAVEAAQATAPPVITRGPDCQALYERSGQVQVCGDRLTSFLYDLMASLLPAGVVERLLRDAHPDISYTNGYLAEYARDVAKRLRGLPPSDDKAEAPKPAEPAAAIARGFQVANERVTEVVRRWRSSPHFQTQRVLDELCAALGSELAPRPVPRVASGSKFLVMQGGSGADTYGVYTHLSSHFHALAHGLSQEAADLLHHRLDRVLAGAEVVEDADRREAPAGDPTWLTPRTWDAAAGLIAAARKAAGTIESEIDSYGVECNCGEECSRTCSRGLLQDVAKELSRAAAAFAPPAARR
jgi:hypothetical protein